MTRTFSEQEPVIIRELMKWGMSRQEAVTYWYNSKTKKMLEERDLYYVGGMRIAWELRLEYDHSPKWFMSPFDM